MIKELKTSEVHPAQDHPQEEGDQVFVCHTDKSIRVCTFSGGKFWLDPFVAIDEKYILWWCYDLILEGEA